MNPTGTNSGGWAASEMYSTLNDEETGIIGILKNKEQIKTVVKQYIKTYNKADSVKTSNDKLWLLSCSEIWPNARGNGTYGFAKAKEGEQYKYYVELNTDATIGDSNLIKKYGGSSDEWWLRSPFFSGANTFCNVGKSGWNIYNGAASTRGVAPGFSI